MVLVKGAKYKQCPNCRFWVEKNEGCDHMTCRCKYEFCYVCGGKYGQCACRDDGSEIENDHLSDIDSEQMIRGRRLLHRIIPARPREIDHYEDLLVIERDFMP